MLKFIISLPALPIFSVNFPNASNCPFLQTFMYCIFNCILINKQNVLDCAMDKTSISDFYKVGNMYIKSELMNLPEGLGRPKCHRAIICMSKSLGKFWQHSGDNPRTCIGFLAILHATDRDT